MAQARAKRLGWDEELTPEQSLDLDPFEGDPDEWLEGEYTTLRVPASDVLPAMTLHLVGGQEADPKTLQLLNGGGTR